MGLASQCQKLDRCGCPQEIKKLHLFRLNFGGQSVRHPRLAITLFGQKKELEFAKEIDPHVILKEGANLWPFRQPYTTVLTAKNVSCDDSGIY